MLKKKIITAFATGTMMLALLSPLTSAVSNVSGLLGGNDVTANTTANISSNSNNTSASVSNQTGANVLGNTVNASTNVTTQLGL